VVQGILTGIGFLGAGVIVKEGLSVRGLTTAASIWTTAVVGILIGMHYYLEALAAVLLILGTLSAFRWIEDRMSKDLFAQVVLKITRSRKMQEPELGALMAEAGLRVVQISYGFEKKGTEFDYELIVVGSEERNLGNLAQILADHPAVVEYRISPSHD
jgi:putative Mg2+ transporter-C (MgtC) family protein